MRKETALKDVFRTFELNGSDDTDLKTYLEMASPHIEKQIKEELKKDKSLKVEMAVAVNMARRSDDKIIKARPFFNSGIQYSINTTNILEEYEKMKQNAIESFATYTSGGSGWIFQSIENLLLKVDRFNPLKGEGYTDLPVVIKTKKAVTNVQNKDEKCFECAILSALHHSEIKEKHERPSKYKAHLGKLNFTGIEFPVSLKDIDKFENQHPEIKVNVFGYEKSVHILRLNKTDPQNAIDLFFMANENNQHYCWLKKFSRLVRAQVTKHKSTAYFCKRCLNKFTTPGKLNEHVEICKENSACKIKVPKPGETVSIQNFKKSMKVPFVIYTDFDAVTEKVDSATPDPEKSYTEKYQKHAPSGFCYYVKKEGEENYAESVVYRGEDCVEKFCEMIEEEAKEIAGIYKNIIPLEMTAEDNEKFQSAVDCHICNKKLNNNKTTLFKKDPIHKSCLPKEYKDASEFSLRGAMEKDDRKEYFKKSNCSICQTKLTGETVRDHDHLTGKFRGAAYSQCNLQYQLPKFVPIIFQNLSGFDSHLFIKQLRKSKGKINCIPNNEEKYISFSKTILPDDADNNYKNRIEASYIDSFKFMASSIDSLSKNLSWEQFREMDNVFQGYTDFLIRKGVYPYDYMDNFERFHESELPPIKDFYSRLNETNVDVKDYEHAQKVLKHFDIKNMGEYHDLYLKTDVIC